MSVFRRWVITAALYGVATSLCAAVQLPQPSGTAANLKFSASSQATLPANSIALPQPQKMKLTTSVNHSRVSVGLTKWDKIQKYYALKQSEVPVPLTQGWDNRVVGQYMPSALSKTGMPTKLKTSVPYAVLTLQDAVLLALRHNPDVKNEQIDRIITKYNNQLALDNLRYVWSGLSLNVNSNWNQGTGIGSTTTGFSPTVMLTNKLGTTLALNYDVTNKQSSATLSQNLLQGFNLQRFAYSDLKDQIKQDRLAYKDSIISTINGVVDAYIDLISAKQDYQDNVTSYKSQLDTLRTTEIKFKIGQVSENTFNSIKSAAASQKFELQTYRNNLRQSYITLAKAMGLSSYAQFKVPATLDLGYFKLKYPPIRQAIDMALKTGSSYINAQIALQQSQEAVVKARDGLKWKLNATYTHNQGVGVATATKDSASLDLTIPLDTSSSRLALFQARVNYEKAKMTFRDEKESIVSNIVTTYQNIESGKIQIQSAKMSANLAGKVLQGQLLQFKLGKITSTDLQTDRATYLQAQQNYSSAKTSFFKQIMSLHVLIGDYLTIWHIKLRY